MFSEVYFKQNEGKETARQELQPLIDRIQIVETLFAFPSTFGQTYGNGGVAPPETAGTDARDRLVNRLLRVQ